MRIFDMARRGQGILEIVTTLHSEGVPKAKDERWLSTLVHSLLANAVYLGNLVCSQGDRRLRPDPGRRRGARHSLQRGVEQVREVLETRVPANAHPLRTASRYLFSDLVACAFCGKKLTAAEAKGGRPSLIRLRLPAQTRIRQLRGAQT